MIRFVHTADIHFGMENYGRVDSKTGIHTRLLDFDRAFRFCVDTAIEKDVDLFLFSGDAYKTPHPTQTQQRLLFRSLLKLQKAGIPVVIVVGNHDNPLSFGKSNALDVLSDLPIDGFHVITKPEILVLTTKSGPVQLVGIPWPTRNNIAISSKHTTKSTAEITTYLEAAVSHIIRTFAQKLDPTLPAILAGHLTVSSGIFSGSEKRAVYGTDPIFLPSQLALEPFDYVGLGHLHRYQNLNSSGKTPIIYSGSIERIDFGERKEEKGFCFVTIKKKYEVNCEFIPVAARPFVQIEARLDAAGSLSHTQQLVSIIERHPIKDSVVKLLYEIPIGKKDQVDMGLINRALESAMHVVGVFPIIKAVERERRLGAVKVDMSFEELLAVYFSHRPELREHAPALIQKAIGLLEEQQERCEE